MKVLVVGSGGREHALSWKIALSPEVTRVYCAPGNGGTARERKCENVSIGSEDVKQLVSFALDRRLDLVVIGPEAPLALGLADQMQLHGVPAFGPSREAAKLESSKATAKRLMAQAGVPTAPFEVFDDFSRCKAYIEAEGKHRDLVVKADGLAAGKGVIVCTGIEEAVAAAHGMLVDGAFGPAGKTVVVEEKLKGREASVLAFVDGTDIEVMPAARDYKRIHDGDRGPNTGGMGSHSPVPDLTAADIRQVVDRVIAPVTAEMAQRGTPFRGVLYAGLMLTDRGPQALEFNVRFGDPETQSIIPRLESDLAEVVWAVASGKLRTIKPKWREECAVCVVASSGGYPGDYSTGHEIAGVEEANAVEGVMVFHAGTKRTPDGRLVTSGGRVLGTTGLGRDLKEAASKAYSAMSRIRFSGMHYRRDVFGSPEGE